MKPDVWARLRLYATEQGGRRGPTPSSKFRCLMTIADHTFDVQIQLEEHGPLVPGESASVPITFLDPDGARGHYCVGTEFGLRELREIGEGTIEAIA